MNYDWLDGYLRSFPGAEHDYKAEWNWDRYMVRGKLFAALIPPPQGMKDEAYNGHPLVNLKCDPRMAELYRAEYPEALPGFYMDKKAWTAVRLDGDFPEELLRGLCAGSYRLVVDKLPKYVRRELEGK